MSDATFHAWLREQDEREDRVGDIARDVTTDECGEGLLLEDLREHIAVDHDASPKVLDAFDAAVAEWRSR